jgi:hypothetical protein
MPRFISVALAVGLLNIAVVAQAPPAANPAPAGRARGAKRGSTDARSEYARLCEGDGFAGRADSVT